MERGEARDPDADAQPGAEKLTLVQHANDTREGVMSTLTTDL